MQEDNLSKLKEIIKEKAFTTKKRINNDYRFLDPIDYNDKYWLLDVKKIIFDNEFIDIVSNIFWEKYKSFNNLQICGLETTAIALVQAIVLKGSSLGKKVNGFYIRKSRNKDGLHKMIEGEIREGIDIVIVDDIINSGRTLNKAIVILEEENILENKHSFSVVQFMDSQFYKEIIRDFKLKSFENVFELKELDLIDGTNRKIENRKIENSHTNSFEESKINWRFHKGIPNYSIIIPKSTPLIEEGKLFFGTDPGYLYCLNKNNGELIWEFKIGLHPKKKGILSSPAIYENSVIFGSYDGNLYSLDKNTGKRDWVFLDADFIGSSPAVSKDLEMVFVGLEYGLFKKKGGISAININTGEEIWKYIMPAFTHSSPYYIKNKKQIIIGSGEGVAYLFDAKNGNLIWKYTTDGGIEYKPEDGGFGYGDIKESFAYSEKLDLIAFSSIDRHLYIVERSTGNLYLKFETNYDCYATPLIEGDYVYFTSADKTIYCVDLLKKELIWEYRTGGRIFAEPVINKNSLYCGSNDGRLYELDKKTGKELGFIQFPKRIVNKVLLDKTTNTIYVPTVENDIYSLTKKL